ncbi:MAG: hypothetical protein Q8L78_04835 [Coxiellaceae bacterium]|nr:hypothetical protein [Coxiellaceae bacterium]
MPYGGIPLFCSEIRRPRQDRNIFSSQEMIGALNDYLAARKIEFERVKKSHNLFGWIRGKITHYEEKQMLIENKIFRALHELNQCPTSIKDKLDLETAIRDVARKQLSNTLSLILEKYYFRLTNNSVEKNFSLGESSIPPIMLAQAVFRC